MSRRSGVTRSWKSGVLGCLVLLAASIAGYMFWNVAGLSKRGADLGPTLGVSSNNLVGKSTSTPESGGDPHSGSAIDQGVGDVRNIAPRGAPLTATGRRQPAEIAPIVNLEGKTSLNQAITEALAEKGNANPQLAQVVSYAAAACNSEPDPRDVTSAAVADPTRDWAIKKLLELCRGFDRSRFPLAAPPVEDASFVMTRSGEDAAVQAALQAIATSVRSHTLVQAGIVLFETGKFPYADALPNAMQSYGLADLDFAWILAVRYVLCHEQGPCGPDSLQVLVYCRKQGCAPGSGLAEAYQRNLSPHMYRAVMALSGWLAKQRAG